MHKAVVDMGLKFKKKKKKKKKKIMRETILMKAVYEMIDKRAITPVRW